jgi:predicted amidohydrolase
MVVGGSCAGHFEGFSWPGEPVRFASSYQGETQIVNGQGEILARRAREDGAGVITADVQLGKIAAQRMPIPNLWFSQTSTSLII